MMSRYSGAMIVVLQAAALYGQAWPYHDSLKHDNACKHSLRTVPILPLRSGDSVEADAILRHIPVFYLARGEKAYPITPEEYFENVATSLKEKRSRVTIIPAGRMGFSQIDRASRSLWEQGIRDQQWFFDVPSCVFGGSSIEGHRDSEGNFTVPVHVLVFSAADGEHWYLQVITFYGYNAPYDVRIAGITLMSGDKYDFQNAHEADLEHVTLEIHTATDTITRIFYGAHGAAEGMWVKQGEFQMEGTHPVVYVARGGHGSYPRAGTWVRVFGFANDVTNKGMRWTPEVRRIYRPFVDETEEAEPGYDADTMGWIAYDGNYGRRGVRGLAFRDWLGVPDKSHRTLAEALALWCSEGDSVCESLKAPLATPPGGDKNMEKLAQFGLRSAQEIQRAAHTTKDFVTKDAPKAIVATTNKAVNAIKAAAQTSWRSFKKLFGR